MHTIKQREILSRAAENSPRTERATYHRDPEWFEDDHYNPERAFVGPVLAAIAGDLIVLLILGPRYGAELLAGVL